MPIYAVITQLSPAIQEALLRKGSFLSDPIRFKLTIPLAGRGKVFEPSCVYVGGQQQQQQQVQEGQQQLLLAIEAASYITLRVERPATSFSVFVTSTQPQLRQGHRHTSLPIGETPEELRARLAHLSPEDEADARLFSMAVEDLLSYPSNQHLCQQTLRLACVPSAYVPDIQRVCERHGFGLTNEEFCFRFHSRGLADVATPAARQNAAKVQELPELGLYLDRLTPADVAMVDSTWAYTGPNTRPYVEEAVADNPNSCVRSRASGRPMAWVCSYRWVSNTNME